MALTKISTDGVKDDAVTTDKLANAINTERTANTAKVQTTINNNADNRVITGSGTASTLNGESGLTYSSNELTVTEQITVDAPDNVTSIGGDYALRLLGGDANNDIVNLRFSTGADGSLAQVSAIAEVTGSYPNSSGALLLCVQAGGAVYEALRINSARNIGIGTSSPSVKLHVSGGDGLLVERSSGTSIAGFKHSGASAMNVYFQNTGSTNHPSIGSSNQDLTIGTNNTERLRVLSGGGLTFNGDTAAANALDDYEEGTFTPLMGGSNYGSYNITGTGKYTKIGRMVHFQLQFVNQDLDNNATGDMRIRGWPYSWSTTSARPVVPMVMMHNITMPDDGNTNPSTYALYGGSDGISMYGIVSHDATDWDGWSINSFESSGLYLDINGSYMT